MNNIIKMSLGIILLFIPLLSFSQVVEEKEYIEVRVSADRDVRPDEIYLDINIHEDDYKKKTIAEIEKTLYETIESVDNNLLAELEVADLASNFKDYFIRKSQAKLDKSYVLKVNDAKTAGLIISLLQEVGISEVNINRTDISNKDEIMDELRTEAMRKAKARAVLMTKAIDQRILRASRITENSSYYPQRYNANRVYMKSADTAAESANGANLPNLEFEKTKLEVTVIVRFSLF